MKRPLMMSILSACLRNRRASAIGASLLLLAGCGGGGGGASAGSGAVVTPPAVVVSVSATPANVTVGQPISVSWNASNVGSATCDASGAWSGKVASSGSQTFTALVPGTVSYTLTCASVSNTASVLVSAAGAVANNAVAMQIDSGPVAGANAINVPFVTVTVCRPGTSTCQTIDHVMVDTGSFGLRLIGPLNASLGLPAVNASSGAPAGECGQFVSGYTWGSVQLADVKIGGETATNQSIQLINGGGFAAAPSACTNVGQNLGTVASLGANGILGVGLFKEDCGSSCAQSVVPATYYACSGGSCVGSSMPLARQVSNPVVAFANDNNGVLLVMPAVPHGGVASLSGTLIFGIGTQANNTILSETRYLANTNGDFTTSYNGSTSTASFIDSGSNALYFTDRALRQCTLSTGFYCPLTPVNLSANNSAFDGSKSGAVSFYVESVDDLAAPIMAASVGGTNGSHLRLSSSSAFDWGMPFFFGRRVFVGFDLPGRPGNVGPYWAY